MAEQRERGGIVRGVVTEIASSREEEIPRTARCMGRVGGRQGRNKGEREGDRGMERHERYKRSNKT